MPKLLPLITLAAGLMLAQPAAAASKLALSLTPSEPVIAGKETHLTAQLTQDGKPLTPADLKEVHTQKFHLLVIDPTLGDYHHLHPTPGEKPGEYALSFTPTKSGNYRFWADVTPVDGTQQFVMADVGSAPHHAAIDKTETAEADVEGYHFKLTFEEAPAAGSAAMGKILVTKDKVPFAKLEPVMGAFGHIVAFSEDYRTVLHVHPLGAEPKTEAARGGPELAFHLETKQAGFIKLYAQIRIDGRDIFAPFGVKVQPKGKAAADHSMHDMHGM